MTKYIIILGFAFVSMSIYTLAFKIDGYVYSWLNAPPWAQSNILDTNLMKGDRDVKILPNARLKLIFDFRRFEDKSKDYWEIEAVSDKNGYFKFDSKKIKSGQKYVLMAVTENFVSLIYHVIIKPDDKKIHYTVHLIPKRF